MFKVGVDNQSLMYIIALIFLPQGKGNIAVMRLAMKYV